jgi:hypothetical protein
MFSKKFALEERQVSEEEHVPPTDWLLRVTRSQQDVLWLQIRMYERKFMQEGHRF